MALGKGLSSLIPVKQKAASKFGSAQFDEEKIWRIPTTLIIASEDQPRKQFNDETIVELAQSIKEKGILQPLIVTERKDGKYDLVSGERRLRASKIAGQATVPAVVKSFEGSEKLEVALIENIQREDLNALDEAFAYKRLIEEFGMTQDEVGKKVGKSRPDISNKVRLLDLPEEIKKALRDGEITMGKARALLGIKDKKTLMDTFYSMLGKKISVRDAEEMIQKKKDGGIGIVLKPYEIRKLEEAIRNKMNTRVNITGAGEKGKIIVEYYSKEEFKRITGFLV